MTSTTTSTSTRARRLTLLGAALATAFSGAAVVATTQEALAGTTTSRYGTLSEGDGVLPARNKCSADDAYHLNWSINPPPGTWSLELFVADPQGKNVVSNGAIKTYNGSGSSGVLTFPLCRNSTEPGVFTASGILSSDDGTGTITYYNLDPATFTLSEAPKVKQHRAARQKGASAKKASAKKSSAKKSAKAKKRSGKSTSARQRQQRVASHR